MKNVMFAIAMMFAITSSAQITCAWSGQNGNVVANSAGGAVSFHLYEGDNISTQGGVVSEAPGLFLSTPEFPEEISFSVYPNPTNGVVTSDLPEGTQAYVYNMQGMLVMTAGSKIDLTELPAGTYVVGAPGYKSAMIVKF